MFSNWSIDFSSPQVIWRTLERMSTPVQDALKIPVPRAEKRRELAEQLLDRAFGVRRRPTLTPSSSPAKGSGLLNGPPLRTKVSDVYLSALVSRNEMHF